ncbi:MFS transporter [Sphaerimonospora sp. CA-214678]|uniref:MFS transporter n=1 Tax=Sphaerimonospora sp. CA-214678 TaxID=3240029 RepID=UPI003D8A10AA
MSSPSRSLSYLAVLSFPSAGRAFSAALLGRLSYGTVFLSLTLALATATGSYALAGAIIAMERLTNSLLSPMRAALIDRYGPHRTLPPMTVLYALLLLCLTVLTWRPGTSGGVLAALAIAAGGCAPPLGPVMRTLWSDLLPDRQMLHRAYSLDTVAEELIFIAGPLLAGLLAALTNPAAGVALSAALITLGVFAFVSSPAVRSARPTQTDIATGAAPQTEPGTDSALTAPRQRWTHDMGALILPVAASVAIGLCLGALSLLMVVFAERHHQTAAVAWAQAALSAGSALGGLAYGAISWRISGKTRLAVLAIALSLALAGAGVSPNLYILVVLAGITGLFVAPTLSTTYLLADEFAKPQHRTQAGAWVNTAFNTGDSVGTAAIGLVVDSLSLALCFLLAAIPTLLTGLMAVGPTRNRQDLWIKKS